VIKKAYLVAVFIVLLAIVTIVALGANDTKDEKTDQTIVYATTKDTNETSSADPEEITETETETTTSTDTSNETTVDTITTESSQADSIKKQTPYTDDDLYYLAAAVCREAGGSSEEIQLLVANVVINRVNSSLYPDTIYDVLTDYRQYGMMWKYGVSFPDWAKNEESQKTISQCYAVAKRVLDGERFCPDNVLFQAEFKQGSGVYKQFDGFYFCYYE
jgi:hypothetical protein